MLDGKSEADELFTAPICTMNPCHMRLGAANHASRLLGLLGRDADSGEVPRLAAVGGGHGPSGGPEVPAPGVLEALVGLAEHDGDVLPAYSSWLIGFSLCH